MFDSMMRDVSMWPAVALFGLVALLSCVAVACDGAASEAAEQESEDIAARLDGLDSSLKAVATTINGHAEDLERMKREAAQRQAFGG